MVILFGIVVVLFCFGAVAWLVSVQGTESTIVKQREQDVMTEKHNLDTRERTMRDREAAMRYRQSELSDKDVALREEWKLLNARRAKQGLSAVDEDESRFKRRAQRARDELDALENPVTPVVPAPMASAEPSAPPATPEPPLEDESPREIHDPSLD